jgi:hypothetical protein
MSSTGSVCDSTSLASQQLMMSLHCIHPQDGPSPTDGSAPLVRSRSKSGVSCAACSVSRYFSPRRPRPSQRNVSSQLWRSHALATALTTRLRLLFVLLCCWQAGSPYLSQECGEACACGIRRGCVEARQVPQSWQGRCQRNRLCGEVRVPLRSCSRVAFDVPLLGLICLAGRAVASIGSQWSFGWPKGPPSTHTHTHTQHLRPAASVQGRRL